MEDGRKSNTRLINDIFWKEKAATILQIPISQWGGEDQIFWGHTKKNNFSVRSAHYSALQLSKQSRGKAQPLRESTLYGASAGSY